MAKRWFRWTLPAVAALVFGLVLGVAVGATIDIPEVESFVEDYTPGLITQLFDRSGITYREYYDVERRFLIEEGKVPETLRDALLASEDRSFFEHAGIDVIGIARSMVQNFKQGKRTQGASTITMQAAGILFLNRRHRTWKRKISEAFYAVELEKTLSKEQILALYCNLIPLGHGNYGFESASRYYFDKSVDQLSLSEAASLVAVVPRPNDWTPLRKPEVVIRRRNGILQRMLDDGMISPQDHQAALDTELVVAPQRSTVRRGAYFAEDVRRYLYSHYGEHGLYKSGLQVRTTLDTQIQAAAESALRRGLFAIERRRGWKGPVEQLDEADLETATLPSWTSLDPTPGAWARGLVLAADTGSAEIKIGENRYQLNPESVRWTRKRKPSDLLAPGDVAWFEIEEAPATADDTATERAQRVALVQEPEVEGAVVVLESSTGAVRSLVGGWSFERNEFNRATQARRQAGSAFKPFVFGAAYESGFTPADTLFDAPVVFAGADGQPTYSPRNFHRDYYGILTLRRALEKSANVSTVKVLDLIGVQQVIDFARRSGISSPLPPYPSLALGVAELSPLEVAGAYAAIANHGVYVEPYLVESVSTVDGRVLEQHQLGAAEAMDPAIAFLMTHTMRGVVQRGTGTELRELGVPIAGKTGTTDGFTDAWFAGFTPEYSIVVWVGYDRKRSLGRTMTGAVAALPVWKELARRGIEEGWLQTTAEFQAPPGVVFRNVEPLTGLLATYEAEDSIEESFLAGTEPVQEYSSRWRRIMELPWYQQRAFYGKPKEGENMPDDIEDWSLVTRSRESSS